MPRDYQRQLLRNREGKRRKRDAAATRPRPQRCEVCHGPSARTMCFDHNHETGEFRGWLCNGCNAALGHAGDNPALLKALANYLDRHSRATTRPVLR